MSRAFFLTLTLLLLMLAMPVRAQDYDAPTNPEDLNVIDGGTVKEVLKSDMIMLDNNKRYRLDNILVPPYEAAAAIDELNHEFLNKKVTVFTYHDLNNNLDRYGVPLAHIVTDNDEWMQGDLVAKGVAWAFSSETSEEMADVLKHIEEKARNQKAGFWKDPAYAVKVPDNVGDYINTYQIVQGKVLAVFVSSHGVFFNFGRDWKTDFTIKAPYKITNWFAIRDKNMRVKDMNPQDWKDKVVRVRGMVIENNGPMIELTHKEQIDIISKDGK